MKTSELGALQNRKQRIFFLYKSYLLEDSIVLDTIDSEEHNFSNEQKDFIKKILDSKQDLEEKISKFIPKDWRWERFNFIEKGIILNAIAEITILDNKKAIVINESIEYARKYCQKESEPLINAILDNINN